MEHLITGRRRLDILPRRRPVVLEPLPGRGAPKFRILLNYPEKAPRPSAALAPLTLPPPPPNRSLPPMDIEVLAARVRGPDGRRRRKLKTSVRLGADIHLNNSNIFYAQARKDAFTNAMKHRQEQQEKAQLLLHRKQQQQQPPQQQQQQQPQQQQKQRHHKHSASAPKSISMYINDRPFYAVRNGGPVLRFDLRSGSPRRVREQRRSVAELEEAMERLGMTPDSPASAREPLLNSDQIAGPVPRPISFLSKFQSSSEEALLFQPERRITCLYLNMDLPTDYSTHGKRTARLDYPLLDARRAREEALGIAKFSYSRDSAQPKAERGRLAHPMPSPSSAPHILSKITLPDASQPLQPGAPTRYPWRLTEAMAPEPPARRRGVRVPGMRETKLNPEHRYQSRIRQMAQMHYDLALQHERTACEPPPPPQTAISIGNVAVLEAFLERRPSSSGSLLPRPASTVSILVEDISKRDAGMCSSDDDSIEDNRSRLTVPIPY